MKTTFPIIFRPKKWTGIKIFLAFALIAGIAYSMAKDHFSDAWLLLVVCLILLLATIFLYFLDINQALIYEDRILINKPFHKEQTIDFKLIEKIEVSETKDSEYGDTLRITVFFKNKSAITTTPSVTSFTQYPNNSKIIQLIAFFNSRLPHLIDDQRNININHNKHSTLNKNNNFSE